MEKKRERVKYKKMYEHMFKKNLPISVEKEEIEFNLELLTCIAKEYTNINLIKIGQGDSTYYKKEKIRLNTIIEQLKMKDYNDNLLSKVISYIVPVFTFGMGCIVTLNNDGITNIISKVNNSRQVITNDAETMENQSESVISAITNYMQNMSKVIISFIVTVIIVIGIIAIIEYCINTHNRDICERKIRFYEMCLSALKNVENGITL